MDAKLIVTVIMPVLNERSQIQRTISSILNQRTPGFDLECLLIDGGSRDGTLEILHHVSAEAGNVKVLENRAGSTPAAFNIGLRAALGEYVCILGAHAEYPPDYIAICLEELKAHGATGSSGLLLTVPATANLAARLAAWCLGHRFACSGSSVRTHPGGFVDTVAYPVMRKRALIEAGSYNENLLRNQDNDMNQRLRAQGHTLYLTARTHVYYVARHGVSSLLRYAYSSGIWNAITLRENVAAMSFRHFVPFIFVVVLAALTLSLLSINSHIVGLALAVLISTHLLLGTLAGIEVARRERCPTALLLPFVILAFHIAYGAGTLAGLLTWPKRRRSPEQQPLPEY
jgi:succinoglycan biosynthesis protein ExoA